MKILIYSDVHGNLPAFEKMLSVEKDCDAHICLGDLVNYGPWGNECVDLALSLPKSVLLMGNHEEDFLSRSYSGSNLLVKLFFDATFSRFDRLDHIARFLPTYRYKNFCFSHTINCKRIFPDTEITLDNNYFIGHSHHQFLYKNSGYLLYNAGSVGQNRKNIRICNYLVFYADTGIVKMGAVDHDIGLMASEMKRLDYPAECMNYYFNKMPSQ